VSCCSVCVFVHLKINLPQTRMYMPRKIMVARPTMSWEYSKLKVYSRDEPIIGPIVSPIP
jgi:hypothetical protein